MVLHSSFKIGLKIAAFLHHTDKRKEEAKKVKKSQQAVSNWANAIKTKAVVVPAAFTLVWKGKYIQGRTRQTMFKSAFNYLADAAGVDLGGVGANGESATAGQDGTVASSDPIVGSRVDVGGVGVKVRRRIGEGGFAFVYAVEGEDGGGSKMALKRLLAVDQVSRLGIGWPGLICSRDKVEKTRWTVVFIGLLT